MASDMHELNPTNLSPHPYSVRIYRQRVPSKRFIEDIADQMEKPLVVNEEDEIIDGVRRWLAVLELEQNVISAIEKPYPSVEAEKEAILRHNDDREESFSQKMRVALDYEEMIAPRLEERMEAGQSLEEQDDDPLLKSKEGETALEFAANRVGWGQTKYWQAKAVWDARESGDDQARNLVTKLDDGEISVNRAYEDLQDTTKEIRDEDYIPRGLTDEDVYADEKRESYGPIQASFETSSSQFGRLLDKTAPYQKLEGTSDDDQKPDIHLEVRSGAIQMATAEQPGVIQSSHSFSEEFFEDVSLEADSPVGIVLPNELAELMLGMMNRDIRIELRGSNESHLAEAFIMTDGSLYTWIDAPDEHEEMASPFSDSS